MNIKIVEGLATVERERERERELQFREISCSVQQAHKYKWCYKIIFNI